VHGLFPRIENVGNVRHRVSDSYDLLRISGIRRTRLLDARAPLTVAVHCGRILLIDQVSVGQGLRALKSDLP